MREERVLEKSTSTHADSPKRHPSYAPSNHTRSMPIHRMMRGIRDSNARRVTRVPRRRSVIDRRSSQAGPIVGGVHGIGDFDGEAPRQTLGEAFGGRLRGVAWERVLFTLQIQTGLERAITAGSTHHLLGGYGPVLSDVTGAEAQGAVGEDEGLLMRISICLR